MEVGSIAIVQPFNCVPTPLECSFLNMSQIAQPSAKNDVRNTWWCEVPNLFWMDVELCYHGRTMFYNRNNSIPYKFQSLNRLRSYQIFVFFFFGKSNPISLLFITERFPNFLVLFNTVMMIKIFIFLMFEQLFSQVYLQHKKMVTTLLLVI